MTDLWLVVGATWKRKRSGRADSKGLPFRKDGMRGLEAEGP